MPKSKSPNYHELTSELDDLMSKLEQGEIDIDEAVEAYERGIAIVGVLEDRLQQAENKVEALRVAAQRESVE